MSKKFEFVRLDIVGVHDGDSHEFIGRADGEWVHAEDAINREAVNADAIRTVELQLKEKIVALHNMEAAAKRYKLQLETLRAAVREAADKST